MRYLMGVYYFCSVGPIDLGIVFIIIEHNIFVRLVSTVVLVLVLVNASYINYLQAMVIEGAHGCYPTLNSLMARKPMSVRLKLKVLSLIEKLSGPEIGFYCFDLFAFTNYAFAQLIGGCVSNLFLFMDMSGI